MSRRAPAAIMPAATARLLGFGLLASLGVAQWARMIGGLGLGRALVWVLAGAGVALAVLACDRLPGRAAIAARAAAVAAGLVAAVAAAGLDLGLLRPRRWDELYDGLARGADALATVRLPYAGADPWPGEVLALVGAVLCVVAGALALWPREAAGRGYPFLSLAVLLVLAATPAVSLGGARPLLFGGALAALTVCFLWLERLPLRPGFGIAALLGIALAGALPLAGAADREDPWFDYRTFAEGIGPASAARFDWSHRYGPIDWPRERREILRVKVKDGRGPEYWKAASLDDFDGGGWSERGIADSSVLETLVPPSLASRRAWTREFDVSVRQVRSSDVVGPGTILEVKDPSRQARRSAEAGRWETSVDLRRGDSYGVRSYTPRPNRFELSAASVGQGGQRADDLVLRIPFPDDLPGRLRPGGRQGTPVEAAYVRFPAFGARGEPRANYPELDERGDGDLALRRSAYARTWELAKKLRRESRTPYEYVVAVDRYLHSRGFVYSERPTEPPFSAATLEAFLFDTREGHCQHYSGAMALLLRMGGVPSRVASGFSPGGYSKRRGEWIVRDTDAHSWVEAWFDRYGWVTFDPTPGQAPARSQVAALTGVSRSQVTGGPDPDAAAAAQRSGDSLRRDLFEDSTGRGTGPGAAEAAEAGAGGGARGWLAGGALAALLGLVVVVGRRAARRGRGPRGATPLDRAVRELEEAFRRSGRPTPPGTTLAQLEARLGGSAEAVAYVRGLRAARYGPAGARISAAGRRAVRRELAYGLGLSGRLRALWALPPRRVS